MRIGVPRERRPDLLEQLRERGITCLALDVVPRISRAQSLDVLSSQANLAGYRAVIEAAAHLGRLFSGQVTAAGKFSPATVYVIGAGVAGLSAIGTAYSLGAQVRGSDVRPEVADQVRSMGAQFVPLPSAQEVSSDGYAKEMSADQASAANALYAQQAAESDVVITTASIPGRRAPMLLDRSAIEAMRPGSVIIDMAAATGGNTELTVPGEVVSTEGGVTIVGHTDLAGMLPAQASQLYGRNIVNLLGLITPAKDGELALDLDDEVVRAITVTHDGELLWPPPPIQVSATPAPGRPEPLHRAHALGDPGLPRHLQRDPRPAHTAHVGDQRDLGDHPGRGDFAGGPPPSAHQRHQPGRGGPGHDQHRRRLRGHPPHARHVHEGLR